MKLDRNKLLQARERLGYGIEVVGEKSGTAKNSVLRAEHEGDIRPSTARKIAQALGVEVADLIKEPDSPKAQSRLSPTAPKETPEEKRRKAVDVWKEQYLARTDEMLDKWESEIEERVSLAESDLVAFFDWLEGVREVGRPLMAGVVSGYAATTSYRLEAVVGTAEFLARWDDLWLRIEEHLKQTMTLSKEDEKRFRELHKKARAVR